MHCLQLENKTRALSGIVQENIRNKWFVVLTKPRMEYKAVEHLQRQGFRTYLPTWNQKKQVKSNWKIIQSPMFPRYLFLSTDHNEQSFSSIRSTYGVSQVVQFGQNYARVDGSLVDSIRKFERSQKIRVYQTQATFNKGDAVTLTAGPFKGVTAEVLACNEKRVILLLELLGKTQSLDVDVGLCQRHC